MAQELKAYNVVATVNVNPEVCPFGRNGEPSEDEYPTANDRCKHYAPKEAYK